MRARTISVQLSKSSIDKAIRSLEAEKRIIESGVKLAMERIAYMVMTEAQELYGADSGVEVTKVPTENGYEIIASGEQVCFLEFGAGTMADSSHPYAGVVPFSVYPGSWSENHAKKFSENGYWYYNGERYEYIVPTRALYNAMQVVRGAVNAVMEEAING